MFKTGATTREVTSDMLSYSQRCDLIANIKIYKRQFLAVTDSYFTFNQSTSSVDDHSQPAMRTLPYLMSQFSIVQEIFIAHQTGFLCLICFSWLDLIINILFTRVRWARLPVPPCGIWSCNASPPFLRIASKLDTSRSARSKLGHRAAGSADRRCPQSKLKCNQLGFSLQSIDHNLSRRLAFPADPVVHRLPAMRLASGWRHPAGLTGSAKLRRWPRV